MFKHAKLSIATLREEGIHTGILEYVDVVIPNMISALKFLSDPDVFCATMRV